MSRRDATAGDARSSSSSSPILAVVGAALAAAAGGGCGSDGEPVVLAGPSRDPLGSRAPTAPTDSPSDPRRYAAARSEMSYSGAASGSPPRGSDAPSSS